MSRPASPDPARIDDGNRRHVIAWLRDRSAFHTWFAPIGSGSFVLVTLFGQRPGGAEGVMTSIAFALLALSLVAKLVSVRSIPSWIYRGNTGQSLDARRMRVKLAVNAWFGVICFVAGVTFAFVATLSL